MPLVTPPGGSDATLASLQADSRPLDGGAQDAMSHHRAGVEDARELAAVHGRGQHVAGRGDGGVAAARNGYMREGQTPCTGSNARVNS